MAKFWYALVNKNSNLTVKIGANNSVIFSKHLGHVEQLVDEAEALDNLVKKGVLTKQTDAEKKIMAKGAKPEAKPAVQQAAKKEEEKPVVKPAPMPKAEPKPEPKPEEAKPETESKRKPRNTEQE